MAYRDPYTDSSRQQADYYGDANDFNPYENQQTQPNYGPSGNTGYDDNYNLHYGNDAYANPRNAPARQATMRSFLTSNDSRTQPTYSSKETPPLPRTDSDGVQGLDRDEFAAAGAGPLVPAGVSDDRADRWCVGCTAASETTEHIPGRACGQRFDSEPWMVSSVLTIRQGGRGRCVGRFCCCSLMTTVYLVLSIFLALLLVCSAPGDNATPVLTLLQWVRPPAISIQDAGAMPGQQLVRPTDAGIDVNLGVNLS